MLLGYARVSTGDALTSHDGRPVLDVFNANPATATASARRLAALDCDLACFGHGEPLRSDAAARLAEVVSRLLRNVRGSRRGTSRCSGARSHESVKSSVREGSALPARSVRAPSPAKRRQLSTRSPR